MLKKPASKKSSKAALAPSRPSKSVPKGKKTTPGHATSKPDIDLAWRRVIADAEDDLVPDVLAYEDFKTVKGAIVAAVEKRVRSGSRLRASSEWTHPKGTSPLCAGAVPEIEDRLVYTAIAGLIADAADKSLEPESVVPSFRVRIGTKDQYLFHFPVGQWLEPRESDQRWPQSRLPVHASHHGT